MDYLDDIINILEKNRMLTDEISKSVYMTRKNEEMFNILQTGGGIKAIIHVAYSFLENPITICDTNFSIIDSIPIHEIDIDFEMQGDTKYLRIDTIDSLRRKNLVDKIFSSQHSFSAHNEISNKEVIFCGIRIKKSVVGYICVSEKNRPFNELDFEFTDKLSKILSIEMQKTEFFAEKSGLKHEYLLKDLIEGRFDDVKYVMQRMSQLEFKPLNYYYIVTFQFNFDDKRINTKYYIEQLKYIFKNGLCFMYNGNAVLLLTSKNKEKPFSDVDILRLNDFLKLNQIHASVSYSFSNILYAHLYYFQSLEILPYLPETSDTSIMFYEDYCISHLIKRFEKSNVLFSAIHPDILFLNRYDSLNNTEYTNTLKCYLQSDRNAIKSAAKLNIHKSTFFYRLSKISDLIDVNITDSKKLFLYELSFYIIDNIEVPKDFMPSHDSE